MKVALSAYVLLEAKIHDEWVQEKYIIKLINCSPWPSKLAPFPVQQFSEKLLDG